MRTPIIAGNWKLNLGPSAAAAYADYLRQAVGATAGVEIVVFPTAITLDRVIRVLGDSPIEVGIQEVATVESGAFTGTNSAVMARELGCTWMLAGHSERRQYFGETDEGVQETVRRGLAAGLEVVLCLGETLEERNAGQVRTVVERQLGVATGGLTAADLTRVTVAYEPVWAIGTGVTASPEQAQEVHATLRAWLRAEHGPAIADAMRILYGGSVKPENAHAILGQPDIDGALVGGASLRTGPFSDIVAAAHATR